MHLITENNPITEYHLDKTFLEKSLDDRLVAVAVATRELFQHTGYELLKHHVKIDSLIIGYNGTHNPSRMHDLNHTVSTIRLRQPFSLPAGFLRTCGRALSCLYGTNRSQPVRTAQENRLEFTISHNGTNKISIARWDFPRYALRKYPDPRAPYAAPDTQTMQEPLDALINFSYAVLSDRLNTWGTNREKILQERCATLNHKLVPL